MTVEFFINQKKAWDNIDEYGYKPHDAILIKVRWNQSLDLSGGRPMDIDRKKIKKGRIGYITGSKREPYATTEAKLDGFDVISELYYPKNRVPIFHKGVEVETVGVLTAMKEVIRPATPMTVKITGSSTMIGHMRGIITSGKRKGKSVFLSTLSSRVIGCPMGEKLVKGRCVKRGK